MCGSLNSHAGIEQLRWGRAKSAGTISSEDSSAGSLVEESAMRTLMHAAAITIAIAASGSFFSRTANAEDFVYKGHKHCWYDQGWKGPGWYWCGYDKREGKGWGGGEGFQGWHH
jgi:hypothetical protein